MQTSIFSTLWICCACGSLLADPAYQAVLDGYVPYQAEESLDGTINAAGSDSLNNLVTLWSEEFRNFHPKVIVGVEGKGSSTAPPALIEGTAQLGPMSRKMTSSEIERFRSRYGYAPTAVPVAIDALAVFVHRDNPLPGLTLEQLDSIFSSTHRRGRSRLHTWGDLGVDDSWKPRTISLYGRNAASGTYGFFKEKVLLGGDYLDQVKEQPGSAAVIQGISGDRFGIGYSGIGYRTVAVRPVPLRSGTDQIYVTPEYQSCLDGTYPLARFLYIYINVPPDQKPEPLTLAFLRFVLSRNGQRGVVASGYYPLPPSFATDTLQSLSSR